MGATAGTLERLPTHALKLERLMPSHSAEPILSPDLADALQMGGLLPKPLLRTTSGSARQSPRSGPIRQGYTRTFPPIILRQLQEHRVHRFFWRPGSAVKCFFFFERVVNNMTNPLA